MGLKLSEENLVVFGFDKSFDKRLGVFVRKNDVLVAVNDVAVKRGNDLRRIMSSKIATHPLKVTFARRRRHNEKQRQDSFHELHAIMFGLPLGLTLTKERPCRVLAFRHPRWDQQVMGDHLNVGDCILSVRGTSVRDLSHLAEILKTTTKLPFVPITFGIRTRPRLPRTGCINSTARFHFAFPRVPLGICLNDRNMRVVKCMVTSSTNDSRPQKGDQLVAIFGRRVKTKKDLKKALRAYERSVDRHIPIVGTFAVARYLYSIRFDTRNSMGISVSDFGLSVTRVINSNVKEVQLGDCIVAVNGRHVKCSAGLREWLRRIRLRGDKTYEVTFAKRRREIKSVLQNEETNTTLVNTSTSLATTTTTTAASTSIYEVLSFSDDENGDDSEEKEEEHDDAPVEHRHPNNGDHTSSPSTGEGKTFGLRSARIQGMSAQLISILLRDKVQETRDKCDRVSRSLFKDDLAYEKSRPDLKHTKSTRADLSNSDALEIAIRDLKSRLEIAPDVRSEIRFFVDTVRRQHDKETCGPHVLHKKSTIMETSFSSLIGNDVGDMNERAKAEMSPSCGERMKETLRIEDEDVSLEIEHDVPFEIGENEIKPRKSWHVGRVALASSSETMSLGEQIQHFVDGMYPILRQHESWVGESSMFFEPASTASLDRLEDAFEHVICSELYDTLMKSCEISSRDRDVSLAKRLKELDWLEPKHLEITRLPSNLVLSVSQRDLRDIIRFKSPVKKANCVIESYRIIAHALRMNNTESDSHPGADDLFPIFVLNVLRTQIPSLFAHVEFIQTFRNHSRLSGEASYCLCHLEGAATFLQNLTSKELSITEAEFVSNTRRAAGDGNCCGIGEQR